jgi:serine/threonine-protein kinase HipA
MKIDKLYVYIFKNDQWVPCGILGHTEAGRDSSSEFVYSVKYLDLDDSIPLDVHTLPLTKGKKSTADGYIMFNGIRDASPDGWGRYVMGKKFPSSPLGELHYLASAGPDRVGALAFGPDTSGPQIWTPDGWIDYDIEYLDLQINSEGIELVAKGDAKETGAYQAVVNNGTGSGGARPKANVIWNGRLHLAKFSISTDPYNIPALEYATMMLAKDCGLDIPNIYLSKALDRDVFLIERFDRDMEKKPYHFASALTMTNIAENEYERFQYRELCETIQKYSDDHKRDLLKLYKRVAFNIMVNNNDDHLRNYGFMYNNDGTWRLSPHYDVVPTINSTGGGCSLSLSLEGGKEASRSNLVNSCGIFQLEEQEAGDVFDEIQSIVTNKWKQHFRDASLDDDDISRFEFSFQEK